MTMLFAVLALLVPLWVVVACIHPPSGGVAKWKKTSICLVGLIVFIAIGAMAPVTGNKEQPATLLDMLLVLVLLAAYVGWPVLALLRRFPNKTVAVNSTALEAPPNTPSQAPSDAIPPLITPVPSLKPKAVAPPRKTKARKSAIESGWRQAEVEFTYEDIEGNITRRCVIVHSVNEGYLKGECLDRRAERTFRLDRIIGDLTDCDTGEIISVRNWARRF